MTFQTNFPRRPELVAKWSADPSRFSPGASGRRATGAPSYAYRFQSSPQIEPVHPTELGALSPSRYTPKPARRVVHQPDGCQGAGMKPHRFASVARRLTRNPRRTRLLRTDYAAVIAWPVPGRSSCASPEPSRAWCSACLSTSGSGFPNQSSCRILRASRPKCRSASILCGLSCAASAAYDARRRRDPTPSGVAGSLGDHGSASQWRWS